MSSTFGSSKKPPTEHPSNAIACAVIGVAVVVAYGTKSEGSLPIRGFQTEPRRRCGDRGGVAVVDQERQKPPERWDVGPYIEPELVHDLPEHLPLER